MKATIDIPDVLYRRVKAQSAMAGRTVRDVTIELYEAWLAAGALEGEGVPDRPAASAAWIERWTALQAQVTPIAGEDWTALEILLADRRT
jgi:hypothetical protein